MVVFSIILKRMQYVHALNSFGGEWVEFNAPPDTIKVISEAEIELFREWARFNIAPSLTKVV